MIFYSKGKISLQINTKGNDMDKYVIGLDIGGTNMRGALLDGNEEQVDELKIPSQAHLGIERLIDNLIEFVERIRGGKTIYGIGLGIPGIIDSAKGVIVAAPNIAHVKDYPIRSVLNDRLGADIKLVIENDANMVGLGEWRKGAGKEVDSMIMITIGTGLGGGLILDGELWSGAHGMGGEIGHMTINPEGPLCNCGSYGCLETYASAVAIRRMVDEALSDGSVATSLRDKVRDAGPADIPELVMEAALGGDEVALGIWQALGKALGIAIASLQNLLDVDMVVLGGGIANAWDFFIHTAEEEAALRGFSAPMEKLSIEKSVLGDDAGILGAGYLALKE
jgi:glucokinase